MTRRGALWHATVRKDGKQIDLGEFASAKAAALVRDIELLKIFGDSAEDLNFAYEIISSTSTELKLLTEDGVVLNVMREEGVETPVRIKEHSRREVITASLVMPANFPIASPNLLPWVDRTQISSTILSAFCYEISFPFQTSLGLNLKPHSIMFPNAAGHQFLGCLTIVDVIQFLSAIIHPGDILLRINDTNLINYGHAFDFEATTRAITTASTPRVLRLMRPFCPAIMPSAVEIIQLAKEINPTAKFHVVYKGGTQSQKDLELLAIDAAVSNLSRIISLL